MSLELNESAEVANFQTLVDPSSINEQLRGLEREVPLEEANESCAILPGAQLLLCNQRGQIALVEHKRDIQSLQVERCESTYLTRVSIPYVEEDYGITNIAYAGDYLCWIQNIANSEGGHSTKLACVNTRSKELRRRLLNQNVS